MSGNRFVNVASAAAVLAALAAPAVAADGAFKADGAFETAQMIGAPRAVAAIRGAVISPRAGPVTQLILLRDRADYVSTAEMIEKETAIIAAEIDLMRGYNAEAEAQLVASRAEVEALEQARETARRAKLRRLRQKLAAQRRSAKARLEATERELLTTGNLREQAVDEGGEVSNWSAKEETLRMERDRLRRMLEQVSQLTSGLS